MCKSVTQYKRSWHVDRFVNHLAIYLHLSTIELFVFVLYFTNLDKQLHQKPPSQLPIRGCKKRLRKFYFNIPHVTCFLHSLIKIHVVALSVDYQFRIRAKVVRFLTKSVFSSKFLAYMPRSRERLVSGWTGFLRASGVNKQRVRWWSKIFEGISYSFAFAVVNEVFVEAIYLDLPTT